MGNLRITRVGAGAAGIGYLLRASGCAEHVHEHGPQPGPAGGPELSLGGGSGAEYLLSGHAHGEAAAVWMGNGLASLGLTEGVATAGDVMAIFGKLERPDGTPLGRRPGQFKTREQRLAAALAAEPDASPERVAEIEREVKTSDRTAAAYFDWTFSANKSASVLEAALREVGRVEEADKMRAAHSLAIRTAMAYADEHVSYTRVGYHGRVKETGRSVGRFEATRGLIMTMWEHSTSREGDPHLHTHVGTLNRTVTEDGKILTLDSRGFNAVKGTVEAIYDRVMREQTTADLGLVWELRPDGTTYEIVGIDTELCDESSTRARQMQAEKDTLVAEYVERHGHEPGPEALTAMGRQAWAATRKRKSTLSPEEQRRRWAEGREQIMARNVAQVDQVVAKAAGERAEQATELTDEQKREVLSAAVAAVQATYPTWHDGNLAYEVNLRLGATGLAPEMVTEQVHGLVTEATRAGNEYGVLLLTAPDLVETPAPLRREKDGRSVFRPHMDSEFATREQLGVEQRIVTEARQQTAPKVDEQRAEELRAELARTSLTEDQAAAVLGVVTSGQAGDRIVGPAGTGKSYTMAKLKQTWEDEIGGRVLGLATSQNATNVLTEEGLPSINIAQFLASYEPDEQGRTRGEVRPGDLYVIDESGMVSTADLDRVTKVVREGGGKVVYTGDPAQLDAVGAGGMFKLLVDELGGFQLNEVRRFRNSWEGEASLRLRAGDTSVLGEYEDRGRLREGTEEEMEAAATRAYLADTVAGRESLLVVGSNRKAAELSAAVRAELVALGLVQPEVLAELRDQNPIGVGDRVQARRNDRTQDTDSGQTVTNREVLEITGVEEQGRIVARRADGSLVRLTADYVGRHVTLAYASTVHAAQGRTVDVCHALAGIGTSLRSLYVSLTRGKLGNFGYVVTQQAADQHSLDQVNTTAVGVLSSVMSGEQGQRTAVELMRAELADAESMPALGGVWDLAATETARDRHADVLLDVLGPDRVEWIEKEHGAGRLYRSLREIELAGHDVDQVVRDVVGERELASAESMSDVLRWRVRKHVAALPAPVAPSTWVERSGRTPGVLGDFERELGAAMDARQAELGERAATEQPQWATRHLGAVPEDPLDRADWTRRAGEAAAYRELYGVPDTEHALGAAPSREMPLARMMWDRAFEALGAPDDAKDFYAAT
ncbi:MAG: relaxase domain-containing protein, partial [Saccharothrix sp.]|nr:relaxase domain-containing protein [Saccharothrix sp.]